MSELLLLLEGDPQDPDLLKVREDERVTQVLSDRVFAIEKPNAQRIAELEATPGLLLSVEGSPPLRIPSDLSETERLWIEAWSYRSGQKKRPGERLFWDAPGFESPDPPPENR